MAVASLALAGVISAPAATVYWDINGATAGASAGATAAGTWSNSASNWSTSSVGTASTAGWTNGNDAIFSAGTNATGTFTVTVSGTRSVSSITVQEGTITLSGGTLNFNDATPNFTVASGLTTSVASTLTGSNGLTINGAGTLILTGNNTYTGTTTISAGVLQVSADNDLGNTSAGVTLNGGTLETTASFTLNASRVVTVGSGGGTFDVDSGTTLTYAGVVTGSGALNKNGDGTFITGGASGNTHTGAININAGVFEIAKTAYVGGIDNASPVTVASGATLRLNGNASYTQETIGSLSGTGTVTNVGAADVNLVYGSNSSTTFSGTLTDGTNDLVLIKNGTGTFTLSGNNSYDGATTINAGALNIQSNTALGTATGATTVASGAALEVQGGITVTGEALTLSGSGVSSNGALRNISGTNTWTGAVTLASASEIQSDAGSLTVSGGISSTNLGLTLDGAGNSTLSGVVALGTGTLTKTGTGTATLSGNNTYSGTTTVSDGILVAAHNNALGAATGNVTVSSGATLSLAGGINATKSTGTLSLAGVGETGQLGALQAGGTAGQTSQYTGDITLTANATIGAANNLLIIGDDYNFDNKITLGSNILTLSTTSASGVVPTYASYPSYTLDASNLYISSTITGTGGVTKTGDGTANLIFFPSSAGVAAYTGDTLVTGGKLIIDGTDHAGIMSTNITVGNASGPGADDSVSLQMGQLASPPSASYLIGDYNNITNVATSSMTIYEDGLFNMNRANNALNNLTLQGGHVAGQIGSTSYALLTVTGGITTLASAQTSLIENGELGLSNNAFNFSVADGTATEDLRVDSIVHNGIGFTGSDATTSFRKTGTGTMVLTNDNDYQGVTAIEAGVLVIRNNDALGIYSPSVGAIDNGTVVSSGAQLQLQQTTGGANLTVGGVSGTETLTLNGTGISSTGALYNATGDNTYHGFVRLASDSRITAASGTTLTISNTAGTEASIMNGTGGGGQDLAVGGPGNVTIGSAIGGLVGDLSKDGSGTLTLAGNNSYAGTTTVGTGGAIKVTHNQGLAGTAVTVNSGGALQFAQNALNQNLTAISGPSGSTSISGTGLSNGGAIQNLNGSNTYLAGVTLGANSRITADSGSSLTLSGNVTGAGYALDAGGAGNTTYNGVISGSGTSFTKTDSGTVTLGGTSANTFSGTLAVNNGTLNLNKTAGVNAVGTSTTITIGDNVGAALSATLALQQSNQMPDATDITINSDGRLSMGTASDTISQIAGTGQINVGSSGHLTIGTDNSSSTFNGTFANSATGSFTKAGTGSLTFTQDISYNGTFNLGGGTLVLDNMDLSVTNLNITANSTIDFGLTGDSHIFAGTLDFLNSSVTLNIINWTKGVDAFYATFWPGATPDLINNGNTIPMSQITFAGWDKSDTGWDSYDNQIYPKVPEPSTYGLMFVGACSAFFAFRRWRTTRKKS